MGHYKKWHFLQVVYCMIEALDVDEESNHVINATIESTLDEH